MVRKIHEDATEALAGLLFDGMAIAAGGFGLCGIPETLVDAILESGIKGITAISNNAGVDDFGLGKLLRSRQIDRMISSYVGENAEFARQYLAGELEIEFTPQGTLAERMRAGGAGIAAFYTRTGVGTPLAEGKEVRSFNGDNYVMEHGIVADLAIVKAWRGDAFGNLQYRKTARNFNPVVATCGRVTVAEVEELVATGSMGSEFHPHPGDLRATADPGNQKRKTDRAADRAGMWTMSATGKGWDRDGLAARAAREMKDGYCVNLGIGIPTLVANHIAPEIEVTFQSENGMLGIGPFPTESEVDPDIINAGKQTITEIDRTSYVSSADSFGMIRGGHLDLSVLGAMEVGENGDLANWMVPGRMVKGPGGAMDLVAGVRRIIVLMDHVTRDGAPKFLGRCALPLTGANVVDMLITSFAVFERADRQSPFRLTELAPGVTLDEVRATTDAYFEVDM